MKKQKIIIDKEFESYMPSLSYEEYYHLEHNIIKEGCRDPIVLWNNILIDGHNRYEICKRHKLPFNIVKRDFKNREQVKDWILNNQLGRRNITPYSRVLLALKKEELWRKLAKENQVHGGNLRALGRQKSDKPIDTKKEIARLAKVSHDTVVKVKYIEKKANKETKIKLRNGDVTINRIHKALILEEKRNEIKNKKYKPIKYLSHKKYSIIYADPPWKYKVQVGEGIAERHYPTMQLDKIKSFLDDNKIQTENDSILFIWATYPMLKESIEVLESWGFRYTTVGFTWVKTTKNNKYPMNLGYWTRANPEICLIGIKGNPQRISTSIPNLVFSLAREHSRKPDEIRDKIVELIGNLPRIELFSRKKINGWDSIGNETIK